MQVIDVIEMIFPSTRSSILFYLVKRLTSRGFECSLNMAQGSELGAGTEMSEVSPKSADTISVLDC